MKISELQFGYLSPRASKHCVLECSTEAPGLLPISDSQKADTIYHSFYSALANTLQNWFNERKAQVNNGIGNDNNSNHIMSQSRLGRNTPSSYSHGPPHHSNNSRPIFTQDQNMKCFSCGKKRPPCSQLLITLCTMGC